MALRPAPLLLLVLAAVAPPERSFGSLSHIMKYLSTYISDPREGQPHFVVLGYVDDQVFAHYDSNSRKMQPRVSWMKMFEKEDPHFWDSETKAAHDYEELCRGDLEILKTRYNQSEGLHTLQWIFGCELRSDGSKGGFDRKGYDGRTFITFNKENLTWVAHEPQAQILKRNLDALPEDKQNKKFYLENICIDSLLMCLSNGKEMLLRTDIPVVTVSSRTEVEDGMETHVCRIHGFYPKEIDASWRRDGEVWLEDTLHGTVTPNADGTYHYWLSIQISPEERGRYRCHVEHDGLQEPLDVALKESNLGFIFSSIVAGLVLACVIVGTFIFFKKRRDWCQAASGQPTETGILTAFGSQQSGQPTETRILTDFGSQQSESDKGSCSSCQENKETL